MERNNMGYEKVKKTLSFAELSLLRSIEKRMAA